MLHAIYSKIQTCKRWIFPIFFLLSAVLLIVAPITGRHSALRFFGGIALILLACRPQSPLYEITMEKISPLKILCTVMVAFVTITACVAPMDNFKVWNGTIPGHRNQYELMAEAILDGHIDFAYGDEDTLAGLKNPYDPDERKEADVDYHWDHAYYKGHYYMYFGVVPVFLLFIPYRLLTGETLLSCRATQLFSAAAIAGLFLLFYMLAKRFFKQMPYIVYLALSIAFSAMSIWYSTAEPALYCTAITSGIALAIWSICFFVYAVYIEKRENLQLFLAGVGALCGALVFGCRPPIGFINLLVLPMLIVFLKQRKITAKLIGKLALAALPYLLVGAALMLYNYVRFENPFEFGQSYQITLADQSQYGGMPDAAALGRLFRDSFQNFFRLHPIQRDFPYIKPSSVFYNFPILLLWFLLLRTSVRRQLHRSDLLGLILCMAASILITNAMEILWAPYLQERYRMDLYFQLGIGCFLLCGIQYTLCSPKRQGYFRTALIALSLAAILSSSLLCAYQIDKTVPDHMHKIADGETSFEEKLRQFLSDSESSASAIKHHAQRKSSSYRRGR